MSKWLMRGHFRHLHFNSFSMRWRTPQGKVFWPLQSNSEVLGVPEDSQVPISRVWVSSSHSSKSGVATLIMCGSKGRHLVISLSYHTNISFIVSPHFYSIMHLSWLATSYSCSFFTMLMWSYHWQSRYPFASVFLQEWACSIPWHTLGYCSNYCLNSGTHV